jgi:DnaJ family protein B protein 13
VLELKADAGADDIKKAYRQLSQQWHPAKNDDKDKDLVQAKFRAIAEAYIVLSDVKLRTIYDQYGMKGLKEGVGNGNGGYIAPWSYQGNPEEQFSDFFGTVSPFAEFFSGNAGFIPLFEETEEAKIGKAEAQIINLYLSLEEMFHGCTKKVKVVRQRLDLSGKDTTPEEKVMTVEVQAGWRAGTKITFTNEGDEAPRTETGDIVFVLKELPHPRFVRAKHDLIYTANISLAQSLTGTIVEVETLDLRTIAININEIVKPNQQKKVPGEGMPKVGGGKGDLLISFNVEYPEMLTAAQKEKILEVLA